MGKEQHETCLQSVFNVFADLSVSSPRKLYTFINKKQICKIKLKLFKKKTKRKRNHCMPLAFQWCFLDLSVVTSCCRLFNSITQTDVHRIGDSNKSFLHDCSIFKHAKCQTLPENISHSNDVVVS